MNFSKKKWASVLLAAALCAAMCGCAAQTASVTIYPDGSGSVITKSGMTEEAIHQYEEVYGVSAGREDMAAFYLNGQTYYGAMESKAFQNVAELDAEFFNIDSSEAFPEADVHIGFGKVRLTSEQGGGYRLEIETEEKEDVEASLPAEVRERYHADGSSGFRQVLTFSFPGDVRQVSGGTKGIT